MSEYALRLAKPHCEACHKPKVEVPWIHEPTPIEKEAVKELTQSISLLERMQQTLKRENKQEEDEL